MSFLEGVFRSAVPGGNISKPLMIALGALLASEALHKHAAETPAAGSPAPQPTQSSATAAGKPPESPGAVLGGLRGLMQRFEQGGLGDLISSWIGPGQNKPISPTQLSSALGSDLIRVLAQKSGLSEQEVASGLSKVLPGIVDKLTPNGRLPTHAELTQAATQSG